ncbi:5-formyltetrahydrofolate cyclo-ligase [Enterococcus sp. AZ194]|uniref:5-formyltetrahydrofolate cyclo-ligase n=1 Tax=Enterococcus sp. AZ194 TaxID=2774629 RepID=UPI003F2138FB
MDKKAFRKKSIQLLQELNNFPELKKKREQVILSEFFTSELWQSAHSVAAIISLGFEFETSEIFLRGWQEGKRMASPKSFPKGKMVFYETTPETDYTISTFGVKEPIPETVVSPQELDLIIVPGLVFSKSGYRIGFGGGYYDRYLANYSGQTCSLVFSEQFQEDWSVDSYDMPVNHLFTDANKGADK